MRTFPLGLTGSLLAITALGGCLGSDNFDFNKQAIEAAGLIRDFQDLSATTLDGMPDQGSVQYTGVASFSYDTQLQSDDPTSFDLLSDVSLTADFDTNDVTGSFTSFNSRDGGVDGTIELEDGAVAGNLMAANATGTITDGDTAIDLSFDVNGIFRGEDGQAISGGMVGSYTPEGGETGELFGLFGAEAN